MIKRLENIILVLAAVAVALYLVFTFQVWVAGYDSLYQYFSVKM